MWIPEELIIENCASHKKTIYTFIKGIVRLISGINLDDEGQENNGSGKSIIPESMAILLTGEQIRKVRISELIRDDENEMRITGTFYNSFTGDKLKIERTFSKNSHKVYIELNGVSENDKWPSVDDKNRRICELFGISKEDFRNYFIIHKDRFKPFFSMSDSDQKDLIARFSGASVLKGIQDRVTKSADKITDQYNFKLKSKIVLDGQLEILIKQFKEIEDEDVEQIKKDRISAILKLIEKEEQNAKYFDNLLPECDVEIANCDKVIDIHIKEIDSLTELLASLEKFTLKKEVDEIEADSAIFEAEKEKMLTLLDEKEKALKKYKKELSEIQNKLADIITCPNCKHRFTLREEGFNIEDAEAQFLTVQMEILLLDQSIKSSQAEYEEVMNAIFTIRDLRDKYIKQYEQNMKEKSKVSNAISQTQIQKLNVEKAKKSKIELKKEELKNKIDFIDNYIQDQLKNIEKIESEIVEKRSTKKLQDEIDFQINHVDKINEELLEIEKIKASHLEWTVLFKKFQNHLANKTIKSIEGYTNLYLEKFGTNLNVLIEGQKLLADGKQVRDEIECHVIRNGYKKGTHGRYSSGEKVRLNLANIKALQKLINLNSKSGGLELLQLDEIIESLDGKGVDSIIKCLAKTGETIDIITHSSFNFSDVDKIKIVKLNGESRLIRYKDEEEVFKVLESL